MGSPRRAAPKFVEFGSAVLAGSIADGGVDDAEMNCWSRRTSASCSCALKRGHVASVAPSSAGKSLAPEHRPPCEQQQQHAAPARAATSAALEFAVPLFEECGERLGVVFGLVAQRLITRAHFEMLGKRLLLRELEQPFRIAHRERRLGGDLPRQFARARQQRIGFGHFQ